MAYELGQHQHRPYRIYNEKVLRLTTEEGYVGGNGTAIRDHPAEAAKDWMHRLGNPHTLGDWEWQLLQQDDGEPFMCGMTEVHTRNEEQLIGCSGHSVDTLEAWYAEPVRWEVPPVVRWEPPTNNEDRSNYAK